MEDWLRTEFSKRLRERHFYHSSARNSAHKTSPITAEKINQSAWEACPMANSSRKSCCATKAVCDGIDRATEVLSSHETASAEVAPEIAVQLFWRRLHGHGEIIAMLTSTKQPVKFGSMKKRFAVAHCFELTWKTGKMPFPAMRTVS